MMNKIQSANEICPSRAITSGLVQWEKITYSTSDKQEMERTFSIIKELLKMIKLMFLNTESSDNKN